VVTERERRHPTVEELLVAAEELAAVFRVAAVRAVEIDERIKAVKAVLGRGSTLAELVHSGERPMLLEATNETLDALLTTGTRLRRLTAQALYAEGLTMDEIASSLGVTRQRVSSLLHAETEPSPRRSTGTTKAVGKAPKNASKKSSTTPSPRRPRR
jgi:DNA-directed RNA polymerase specialized sigma24 family protein